MERQVRYTTWWYFTNELKNNAFKIGKWTASTILSGADQMKLGFVSRVRVNDAESHHILGTQFYKPLKFAEQINLSVFNMWGVLRGIIDVLMKQEPGKYLLLKDPNQKNLRVYGLPPGTFSDDEDSSDEDDDDDEEDEGWRGLGIFIVCDLGDILLLSLNPNWKKLDERYAPTLFYHIYEYIFIYIIGYV